MHQLYTMSDVDARGSGDNKYRQFFGVEIYAKHLTMGMTHSKCAVNYVYKTKQLKAREF